MIGGIDLRNRSIWDTDTSDDTGYSGNESSNSIWGDSDSSYDSYNTSSDYGSHDYDNYNSSNYSYDEYGKDDSYSSYSNDTHSDSYGESNRRTSGWKKFEDLPTETHSSRRKSNFSLKDVPLAVWIFMGVVAMVAVIVAIVMNNGSAIRELNNGIENVAAAIIAYLVYVGIVWLVFYFTFGRRMHWRTRSIFLGIICLLVLLCNIFPSLGLLLIVLCILLVLLYKIFRP